MVAEHTKAMCIIDHQHRIVSVACVCQPGDFSAIAVHAEDAVAHDELFAAGSGGEFLLEVVRVVVLVTHQACPGKEAAIEQRSMVQTIFEHGIAPADKGLRQAKICHVAGGKQQGVATTDVTIYMATLGKALGTAGAFIAGSDELIETLIQKARTYIYTTASPPAVAEAARTSLKLIASQPQLRERLDSNIRYFRNCCHKLGVELTDSQTAIQPVIIGDTRAAVNMSGQLLARGLLITAIRPPTVPEGTARLRITLSAAHRHTHIDKLVSALNEITR